MVKYGGGTTGGLSFSASSCVVGGGGAGSSLTCQTGAGIGAGLDWKVTIGGQDSNILPAASSYGAPTVAGFLPVGTSDPRALFTDGSQSVYVMGTNFGPAVFTNNPVNASAPLLAVQYSAPIAGGPVTEVLYNAVCSVVIDNTQLLVRSGEGREGAS